MTAVLYASYPAFPDAVLAEERGWRELSVPSMSMIVFRHEVLTEPRQFRISDFELRIERRFYQPVEERSLLKIGTEIINTDR